MSVADTVSVWFAAAIMLVARVEPTMYYLLHGVGKFFTYFRFWAVILASRWVLDLFSLYYFVDLPYLGKVTEAFPFNPSGYKMAPKIAAWRYLYLPLNIVGLKEATIIIIIIIIIIYMKIALVIGRNVVRSTWPNGSLH